MPTGCNLPLALRRVLRGGHHAPALFAPASAGLPAPDAAGRRALLKWRGWQLDAAVAEALAAGYAALMPDGMPPRIRAAG